ncbi:MAG: FtsK/SpoIIIE domain-containing protein [Ilumatobacteraceae bacterium]
MSTGLLLRVVGGPDLGTMVAIDRPVVVGREGELMLTDPTVSRAHARLEPTDEGVHIADLGSSGGVAVNGRAVRQADLRPADVVALGSSSLRLLRLARHADAATGPTLRMGDGGAERVVSVCDGMVIGRDEAADLRLDRPAVSRRHAVVHVSAGRVVLADLGSANGTIVSGRAVQDPVALDDGAVIEIGSPTTTLVFHEGARAGAVTVRLSAEGSAHVETVTVDATTDATVAQVTDELTRHVDAPDETVLLYRLDDGSLLHPDDRWSSVGVRAGDHFVVGAGDASGQEAAKGLRWREVAGPTLNQLPRTVWPEPAFVIERIDPPESTSFRGRGVFWQVAGGLGAVLIGLTLVLVNPSYAVFGIITGGIGIISIAASILGEQSRRRHQVHEYRRRLADLDRTLDDTRRRQSTTLHALSPSIDELDEWLTVSSSRLWERRPTDPDALRPTLGIGRRTTRIEVERSRTTDSPLSGELDAVLARHAELDRVPVVGPGHQTGSLGVTGDQGRVRALLARVVVEAAALHPPSQLQIWVAGASRGWNWCRWLPHVPAGGVSTDPAEAALVLTAAVRAVDETGPETLHLVVVPETSRRVDIGALQEATGGRLLLVVGGGDRRDLPSGLAVVVDIDERGRGDLTGHFPDAPVGAFDVGGIGDDRAELLAIALGRLGGASRDVAPSGLVELLELGSAASVDVAGSWRAPPIEPLTVAVGTDDTGAPVTIGFRRDGPHGVIAGTTGSGKSELLQTVLTALTLRHPPDRLNLFLVDFKGGSTFGPLADLPHVVGVVTDLEHDASLATRALTALDAEIERRKRVLEAARVPDVVAYARRAGQRPLPDLLVVIDEFALLMERQPEVRERLDTIATQGRSLGIHLLLATQSPSGVISHAIRTNTNLWVCLRVVAESESLEILGARDAARIPDGSPGRAIIRLGAAHELRTFQAARIARPVGDQDAVVRVTRAGGGGGGGAAQQVEGATTTELDLVVRQIVAAAAEMELESATALWLPPLPVDVRAADVEGVQRPEDRLTVLVGLADHPREHAQRPWSLDLSSSGHALVMGVFGSGKTSTLRQIGFDLAAHRSPGDVHVYGIDSGSGSLAPLIDLPHVGDVVGVNDVERLTRLVDRLTRAVDERRDGLAVSAAGDFLRWRSTGVTTVPWIVVLVDDYVALREVAEQVESGRLLERLNSLLQHGPAVGIHVVVTATQAGDLRTRDVNLMPTRLVLRAADVADYALVDVRVAPPAGAAVVPGRALTSGGVEVQVCRADLDATGPIVDRWAGLAPSLYPAPIARLPVIVRRDQLSQRDGVIALGVGGPEVDEIDLALEHGSALLLVVGPSQSGRSTALASIVSSLPRSPTLVVAPRPSPLWGLDGDDCEVLRTTAGVDDALDAWEASARSHRTLVIDDAESIVGVPGVGHRLEPMLRNAAETATTVLVAARVSDLSGMFDPWARYLVSVRRALLLWPTVDDAFLFGIKLPAIPPPVVPGRGVFVDRGRATVLQVAAPAEHRLDVEVCR